MIRAIPKLLLFACSIVGVSGLADAADFQGVVVDRSCADQMAKDGRAKTLKNRSECSMRKGKFQRPAYALITDDSKIYWFDDEGNKQALNLLKGTPDPDNLKVIVTGDLDGQTIKVQNMSML